MTDLSSLPQAVWALCLFFLILGVLVGWLIWGRALNRQEQVAFELAHARSQSEQGEASRVALERELASSRDQVRPLADEVERLRREVAKLSARGGAATTAVPLAAGAGAATLAPAAAPAARHDLNDLRLLKGVGDKMIARLETVGIRSNADLASLDPEEAARADASMGPFEGRIARDRLIEQARLLADGRVAEFEARFGRLERV